MSKQQFVALFAISFAAYFVGGGLMGLLPVYLGQMGVEPSMMGFYFACAFVALAISSTLAGRLSKQFGRRKPFIIGAALLAGPLVWLMGQSQGLVPLMLFTTALWFVAGIITTMVNILAGLYAEESERGRVFGILGLAIPLSGLVSGFVSGYIVDYWGGYPSLFTLLGLSYLTIPLTGIFLQDRVLLLEDEKPKGRFSPSMPFILLFLATALAHVVNAISMLSRPLIMDGLNYDATAISIANAMGGLIALPLPILVGWLSDRVGRKSMLIFCFIATGIALIVLLGATDLWQFWLSSALQTMLVGSIVVGSAFVSDMYDKENLSVALSIFGASPWVGFVLGFSLTGSSIQAFTINPTLIAGIALTFVACAVMFMAQNPHMQPE
jgi:MFS transporter, DHA1 family, multidrug resistance protein